MKTPITLRLPEELRIKIKEEAKRGDMSINQYVLYTLTKEITEKETERRLKERIKQAPSREEALRLLYSMEMAEIKTARLLSCIFL
jgi:hypothetical protein